MRIKSIVLVAIVFLMLLLTSCRGEPAPGAVHMGSASNGDRVIRKFFSKDNGKYKLRPHTTGLTPTSSSGLTGGSRKLKHR